MKTRVYQHVFFDLDHTLWDFDRNARKTLYHLHREFQEHLPPRVSPEDFSQRFLLHNQALWNRYQEGKLRRKDFQWKRFWLTLLDFGRPDPMLSQRLHQAYAEILPQQPCLVPQARETLEYMACHYSLHLITNGMESVQVQKLKSSGIDGYFLHVISSEISLSRKPHPEIFAYAQSITGARPQDSVMIGDRYDVDILGARRAGWDQIYFNPGRKAHGQQPTMEIHSLGDLVHLL